MVVAFGDYDISCLVGDGGCCRGKGTKTNNEQRAIFLARFPILALLDEDH